MTARKIASVLALSGMLIAGSAFAQTSGTGVSTTTNSVIPSTGSGAGASATTTTGTGGTGSMETPGVPNTGSGGEQAANLLLLGTSALVALGGAAYLSRKWAR